MPHYKNFAQCVEQLLKEHHLTVSRFGAQIGAVQSFAERCPMTSAARGAPACVKSCARMAPLRSKNARSYGNRWRSAASAWSAMPAASPSTGLCPSRRMNRRSRAAYPAAR